MGERRKTLNIWLKRTWDRGRVEGTRLEAKDTKNIRGQRQPFRGQTVSRSRTQAQVFSKKNNNNNKVFKNFFSGVLKKTKSKNLQKTSFSAKKTIYTILRIPKILLFSSRGEGIFRGLEASRPRTLKCVLEDSTSVNGMYQYSRTEKQLKAENKMYPAKHCDQIFPPSHSPLRGIQKKKNQTFETSL